MTTNAAQNTGFALILIGTLLSFGRDYLSGVFVRFQTWRTHRPPSARLKPAVTLYLMMTGMILTLFGVLELFGVIQW